MIPTSVSASALETASQCLARYKATAIMRGASINNPAAMLGTTLHAALERFIEPAMISQGVWDWEFLLTLYTHSFQSVFGSDEETRWFDDGKQVLWNWYNRGDQQSDLMEVEIVSREVKKNFEVPYYVVENGVEVKKTVPLNYIMDRFDKLGPNRYRVVDYKSQRIPLSPDQLRRKIQAKVYALACQIEHPDAEEVWVQFDFLRYDRVGVRFTRADNADTWRAIKRAVQRIVDTDETDPPETLNENCRYCPAKFTCKTLQSNLRIGGVMSLDIDQLAALFHDLKAQNDALQQMQDEVEHMLLTHAHQLEALEFDTEKNLVEVKSKRRRKINRGKMAEILGPEIMSEYGRINVSDLDSLRSDRRLTPTQRSLIETAVEYEHTEPSIRVTKRSDGG